jgi:hypothetical protein
MKNFPKILLAFVFLISIFNITEAKQQSLNKSQNFYVIASIGNNFEVLKNTKITVGYKIDINKNSVIIVNNYLAGIYQLNNLSFEFRGPGVFNIDSAIKNKKINSSRNKLLAFVISSVKGGEDGKNIKSASVEMSINPKVVTFPTISKQTDSIFTLYWNSNLTFINNSIDKKIVYSLIILNSNNDTCFHKYYYNTNYAVINSNKFKNNNNNGGNNIYHWYINAYPKEDNKISSNLNTFILEKDSYDEINHQKDSINTIIINNGIDNLMLKLDYTLRNANYFKSLEYARILDNVSPGTGKSAVQYSLRNLLDYNVEDTNTILPILFAK